MEEEINWKIICLMKTAQMVDAVSRVSSSILTESEKLNIIERAIDALYSRDEN
jgi:hypothetical protein